MHGSRGLFIPGRSGLPYGWAVAYRMVACWPNVRLCTIRVPGTARYSFVCLPLLLPFFLPPFLS
jgi:hypothetical protein